jgi:hypothetical protein
MDESHQSKIQFDANKKEAENNRAFRISLRMRDDHFLLANIYENLVDRDFKLVELDIDIIIMDLRLIKKSLEDDDF